MRKFITTSIIDPVKAPITEKALRHINDMTKEVVDALIKSIVPNYITNDIVVLLGCSVSGSVGPGTAAITEGAIYYNGEIYLVDANASISSAGGQTLVWEEVDLLQDSAQTTFSDGVLYDFLSIRKLQLVGAAPGIGIGNYTSASVKNIFSFETDTDVYTSITATSGLSVNTQTITAIRNGATIKMSGYINLTSSIATSSPIIFGISLKNQYKAQGTLVKGTIYYENKIGQTTRKTSIIPAIGHGSADGVSVVSGDLQIEITNLFTNIAISDTIAVGFDIEYLAL